MKIFFLRNYTSILGLLNFKNNYQGKVLKKLERNLYFNSLLIIKKKFVFFHYKISLVSEIVLYSKDLVNEFVVLDQKNPFYRQILKKKNFYIIQKLGTGSNLHLVFGSLCKIWVQYKNRSLSSHKRKGLVIAFSSREDRIQAYSIFQFTRNIFHFIIVTNCKRIRIILNNKLFFINLISFNLSSALLGGNKLAGVNFIMLRGNFFVPEYYLSFIKLKNLDSLKNQTIQKILIFNALVLKKVFYRKRKFLWNSNEMKIFNANFYKGNQIIDISDTSFSKICKIMGNIIRLKKPKIIRSYSWGRCLILSNLLVKTLKKSKIGCKNIEIVKVKNFFFIIFTFQSYIDYFTFHFFETKEINKINLVFFYDISENHEFLINLFEFLKIKKLFNIHIFFIIKLNKTFYHQLFKNCLFENKGSRLFTFI